MRVLRVFNNNVVLARDGEDREVILTGRGVGFRARPGSPVDPAKVQRTFVPVDGRDPDNLARMLADISPEHVQAVLDALAGIGLGETIARNPATVVALADHVSYAIERLDAGLTVEYPLRAEVESLYAEEYGQGVALLAKLNAALGLELPGGEAVALALHLINAGFASGDLSYTYRMTAIIQQLFTVIEQTYGRELDRDSVSVGRFVTHLRYLFVRIHRHRQLDDQPQAVGSAIRDSYPTAMTCSERLAALIELRLGSPLTADEIAYLALHVARVAADQ